MRHRLMLSVLSVLVAAASATAGESFVVDRGQSEVSFEVRHVTGPVTGAFTDFEGTVEYDPVLPGRSSVEFRYSGGQHRDQQREARRPPSLPRLLRRRDLP